MKYQYILANPTGNITALVAEWGTQNGSVAGSDENRNERLAIVKDIFETEPSCEQVGFVRVTGERRITLEMMGGEFCGNATLSAAAYCAKANNLFWGGSEAAADIEAAEKSLVITVDSSGTDKPVPVELRCLDAEAGEYEGTLEMPMPTIENHAVNSNRTMSEEMICTIVHLDGISHMIVPAESITREEAEAAIKGYADQFGALAFGMLLYSEDLKLESSKSDDFVETGAIICDEATECPEPSEITTVRIEPLVYVKGSDTMVWEHGCASGSIAAAYYKYNEMVKTAKSDKKNLVRNDNTGLSRMNVCQPGGVITIEIAGDKLYLTGKIQL